MTFDKLITLATYTQPKGSGSASEIVTGQAWAKVSQPGVITQYSALAAGKHAELQVTMWRSEYQGENRVIIDGVHYRVDAEGAAKNKLHIKLMLIKGG